MGVREHKECQAVERGEGGEDRRQVMGWGRVWKMGGDKDDL